MAITRSSAMQAHRGLVREGHLEAAHLVLRGIGAGMITLRLSQADLLAEAALEEQGATFSFDSSRFDGAAVIRCRVIEDWIPSTSECWDQLRRTAADLYGYDWQGEVGDITPDLAEEMVNEYCSTPEALPTWWDETWRHRLVTELQAYFDRDVAEETES